MFRKVRSELLGPILGLLDHILGPLFLIGSRDDIGKAPDGRRATRAARLVDVFVPPVAAESSVVGSG